MYFFIFPNIYRLFLFHEVIGLAGGVDDGELGICISL